MAFLRKTNRAKGPEAGRGRIHPALGGLFRWVAVPGIGLALATWSITTVAGVYASTTLASTESFVPRTIALAAQPLKQARVARLAPSADQEKSGRLALAAPLQEPPAAPTPKPVLQVSQDPFAKIVASASLSPKKMLEAFAAAGMDLPSRPVQLASAAPADARFYELATLPGPLESETDRFGPKTAAVEPLPHLGLALEPQIELAYASPDPTEALNDWDRFGPLLGSNDEEESEDPAIVEGMPNAVPLPDRRPKTVVTAPQKPETAQPKPAIADKKPETTEAKPNRLLAFLKPDTTAKPKKPERAPKPAATEALAFAKPDKPRGMANSFRNLFDTPKAGNGTAIYDISAGVVHMPDGSKLEAHSGIGKMADNPKYVHVKMNGPTPPNTYKLTMRESRFYGVEAIRMTPVGKQTMHGRTGILAHSYLLRGGRAESHGCVAFKDYNRFLAAFKKGKVKQIVVVPSLSRAPVRMASTGSDT